MKEIAEALTVIGDLVIVERVLQNCPKGK